MWQVVLSKTYTYFDVIQIYSPSQLHHFLSLISIGCLCWQLDTLLAILPL
ncbi:hypothetical protein HanXRQr2_Chr15g0701101 [Helianthus annuus]|uniref:Uncharacterized protein n=1 Tax=Helianthus annuus TaxID=4232 RepID=A0A9K3E1C1_HELAN|nr:hypothetical protein HanXRQr2_Chr15g0701101 [Helianthus annuus]KAJ0831922.1 hypothetical protein HanPSC8_Chr15g0672771 [Helianthus annuus]